MNKTRLLFFSFFFTDGGRNLPGYTGLGLASIQLAEPRTILPFLDIKMKKKRNYFLIYVDGELVSAAAV
jgi:hypothetical protein